MDKIREGISYAASLGTGIWGLTVNEWLALGGFGFAAATFVINWVYKRRYYELAVKESDRKDK